MWRLFYVTSISGNNSIFFIFITIIIIIIIFWPDAESFEKKFIKIKYSRNSLDPENSRCGHEQPYNFFFVFADFRTLRPKSVDSKQKS